MAGPYYVDSNATYTDGLSWSGAYATLGAAAAVAAAGEIIYCASNHSETTVGSSITWAGTLSSPVRVISATSGTTTYAKGASVLYITSSVSWGGGCIDVHGLRMGSTSVSWVLNTGMKGYDNVLVSGVSIRKASGLPVSLGNTEYEVSGSGYYWWGGNKILFHGGFTSGSTTNGYLVRADPTAVLELSSFDISSLSSGTNLALNGGAVRGHVFLNGIVLPTAGGVVQSASVGVRVEAYSVGVAGIQSLHVEDTKGTAVDSTATYRDATYDGASGYSLVVTPTSGASYSDPFRVQIFEDYVAANQTFTVHMVHGTDSDLQNDEVWIEIEYPDSTTPVLRNIDVTSRAANITTASSSLTTDTDTAAWTSPPASPAYDKIAVLISGGAAGVHTVTLCYGKPSGTALYVCPDVVVT